MSTLKVTNLQHGSATAPAISVAVGGGATVLGITTFHNNIDLVDNAKINIGASADLQIYHNGSHSFISDEGAGQLTIMSNGAGVEIQKGTTEFMGRFLTDGPVELYYDHSKKFETTTSGATITGDLTLSDKIIHGGDTNTAIRFPAADTFSVETAGTERLRITSAGAVGVGTIAPTGNFEVSGNDGLTVSNATRSGSNGAQWRLIPHNGGGSATNLRLFEGAGSTEVLNITKSGGYILVNTQTSRIVEDSSGNGPQGKIQIEGLNSDAMLSIIAAKNADTFRSGCISLGAHRGSVGGTPTILQNGDTVGGVLFAAGDGSDMRTKTAQILSKVDGAPSANDVPGRLVFATRKSGGSLTERLHITSDGKLILSDTQRTTPFIVGDGGMCIEQSYDGNLRALTIRNKDTDAAAATSLAFSLNRSGGDHDFAAGEIKLEKEQAWTTTSSTVDSALVFSTMQDESLVEKLRIRSNGFVGINETAPGAQLTVKRASTSTSGLFGVLKLKQGSATNGNSASMLFSSLDDFDVAAVNGRILTHAGSESSNEGRLEFWTKNTGESITERMRIQPTGFVQMGSGHLTATTYHRVNGINNTQGDAIFVISGYQASGGSNQDSAVFYSVNNNGSPNAAGTCMRVFRDTVSLRSINAAGTLNASGNDYAEYMTKAGDFTLAKGDVCGVNSEGKLTNVFADAVSFVVKSTDPSYVGGDKWHEVAGVEPGGYDDTRTEEEIAAAKVVYKEALESARQLVDRIAFSGQVPVNVTGTTPGQYIIPTAASDGSIEGTAKAEADLTISEYMSSVGKVIAIEDDGRARIIVKVC